MSRLAMLAAPKINMTPDFNAIPGAGPLQQLINGIGGFSLLLALAGVIIGGAMWGSAHELQLSPGSRRQTRDDVLDRRRDHRRRCRRTGQMCILAWTIRIAHRQRSARKSTTKSRPQPLGPFEPYGCAELTRPDCCRAGPWLPWWATGSPRR